MWTIIAQVGIGLLLYGLNYLTRPHSPPPTPRTRDSLDLPRTEEGTAVPIVFGRCQVKSPLLAWTSDLNTKMGPDDQYITYGLHMLFVVGIPMGNGIAQANQLNGPLLHNVWLGDKLLPSPGILPQVGWNTTAVYNQMFVGQPSFLGGPGNGGGLIGTYQWFGGWTDQSFTSPPSRIGDAMTPTIPAGRIPGHRRQMCVAFSYPPANSSDPYFLQTYAFGQDSGSYPLPQGFVLGESPDVNGFAFEVSSYGDKVFSMGTPGFDFGGDADPAEVIYDILTNPWGRLGLDVSKIDTVSFAAASATLKAEGHGYSMVHYQSQDAHDVITGILQQIDATLYEEPTTGKFILNLIRFDYDPSAIPSYDTTNIIEVRNYAMGSWRDTVNEVRVRFTDRAQQYNIATVVAASMANAVGNSNRRRPKQIDYLGISNQALAAKIAARDLQVLSTPFAKIQLTVNRDAWMLRPGQVFKVTYPEFGLSGVVFRAAHVDLGKLESNEVTIDAVQDSFASTYAGQALSSSTTDFTPQPLSTRYVIESPRWLCHEANLIGLINDPDMTRMLALAVPGSNDIEYYVNSQMSGGSSAVFNNLLLDIPRQVFPTVLQVQTAYSRTLEPYDTTTGLVVNNLKGGSDTATSFLQRTATSDQITKYGRNVLCIVRANGEQEFIAYESVTDLGSGSYRLNNVWRGLLDTPPLDHSVGEYCFLVTAGMIGRKAWKITQAATAQIIPSSGFASGSGADPVDAFPNVGYSVIYTATTPNGVLTANARSFRPLPAANFGIFGEGCQGVSGLPVIANQYKSILLLEEGIDLLGFKRELRNTTIVRGDSTDDTLVTSAGPTTYFITTAPAGRLYPEWTGANTLRTSLNLTRPTRSTLDAGFVFYAGTVLSSQNLADGAEYQINWYGSIDIGMFARLTLLTTNPAIGKGGLDAFIPTVSGGPVQNALHSYATPHVTSFAPSWRNLIANARFNYSFSSPIFGSTAPCWGFTSGSPAISSGAFSLSRASSGPGSYWLGGSGAFSASQGIFVTAWFPRGLTALASVYFKNTSGTVSTGTLSITDDATGSAAGTATAGNATNWQRLQTTMTITASSSEVIPAIAASSNLTAFTEAECRVGTFQANVLTNYSFETALPAGWTNITNSFVQTGTIQSPSLTYVQGGAFASSVIRQEYTLPAGWEVGSTAIVSFFFALAISGDTGAITLSAIDGGGATLATSTISAGGLGYSVNTWKKLTTFCDIPDGTVKVRVDLTAIRTGGGGNSGACFDEVVLTIAKDQAPRYRKTLDFGAPTVQPMPNTIRGHQLQYPALPLPDHVFGGTTANEKEVVWTDQTTHAVGKFTGQFGGVTYQPMAVPTIPSSYGTSSVDAYVFTRGSGAGAVHLAAQHQGYAIGQYGLAQSFSVLVAFFIDEPQGFGGRCGIIGRMDLSQGWGFEINGSGQLTAVMRGAGSTSVSVSLARTCTEGGRHRGGLVYDSVAQTLTVYDELGSASVSTASLGEILGTSSACHLRIGRDADDADVMPGMIGRVYLYKSALTGPQVASTWALGGDPTGLITTYTRSGAAWHTVPSDSAGEVLTCSGPAQIAMPWIATLTQNDSFNTDSATPNSPPYLQTYKRSGHGLAYGRSSTNRITSWDFTNATVWVPDASTTLTQGIVDASGRAKGVTIAGNATNGLKIINVGVGAVARNATLSFWARGTAGAGNLTIELLTGAGVLVTSTTVSLTALWKRYDVVLAFSGATATCQWRFRSTSGSLTFDLTSVMHSSEWSSTTAFVPPLIANPGSSTGDVSALISTTLPIEFNSEGEIVATFCALRDPDAVLSPAVGTLVQVKNGSNTKNQRELQVVNNGNVRLAHTDGAASPATVNSSLAAPSSTLTGVVVKARGRWNRIGTLDPNGTFTAQVALADSAHPTLTFGGAGRTVAWTNDTTQSTQITLGSGTAPPDPVVASCIVIQAREEKLP